MKHTPYYDTAKMLVEMALLKEQNKELLEMCEAFKSFLEDDSKSERRRNACLWEVSSLIAKAKGE